MLPKHTLTYDGSTSGILANARTVFRMRWQFTQTHTHTHTECARVYLRSTWPCGVYRRFGFNSVALGSQLIVFVRIMCAVFACVACVVPNGVRVCGCLCKSGANYGRVIEIVRRHRRGRGTRILPEQYRIYHSWPYNNNNRIITLVSFIARFATTKKRERSDG